MADERTELQRRMDERLLPLGQRFAKPFSEAINSDNVVNRAINTLSTTTPGQVGEAVGRNIARAPQDTLNTVEFLNEKLGVNALKDGAKGFVRGVFGSDDVTPRAQAAGVSADQLRQAEVLRQRHAGRLNAQDAANTRPVASSVVQQKPRAALGTGAAPRGNPVGDRTAQILKSIQNGEGVEVIRGLQRSHKLFDQVGPGQDGEFPLSSLQPGALAGIEQLQRAGSEGALQQQIKADGIVRAAQINSQSGQDSLSKQLINHYTAQGLSLPEAVQAVTQLNNPKSIKDTLLENELRVANDPNQPPERRLEARQNLRAYGFGIQPSQIEQVQQLQR